MCLCIKSINVKTNCIKLCSKIKKPPVRFWMGVLFFFSGFINNAIRTNISVSIVKMVHPVDVINCNNLFRYIPPDPNITYPNRFPWTEHQQGHILSAYYFGFILSSLLAGFFLKYATPFTLIFYSTIFSVCLNTLTPLCARQGGWRCVIANRYFVGLLGGIWMPSLDVLVLNWSPYEERSKFMAALLTGCSTGPFLIWWFTGYITYLTDWQHGFFSLSIIGCIFCACFVIYASNSPLSHFWISEEELKFITTNQRSARMGQKMSFKTMIKSKTFWILALARFGTTCSTHTISIYGPKFVSNITGYNIAMVAFLAALPIFFRAVFTSLFVWGDKYINKLTMSDSTRSKIGIMFSHFVPAGCLLLIPHFKCNFSGIEILLIISQIFNASIVISNYRSSQDVAPHYAGTFFGTLNAITHLSGCFVTEVNGAILTNSININYFSHGPYMILAISGFILMICGVVFIYFGPGEITMWKQTNL